MTCRNDCTLPGQILEQIAEQGLDYLPELIRVAVNAAMKAERQRHLEVRSFSPHFVLPKSPPCWLPPWDSPSEECQTIFTEKYLHYL